MLVWLASYPRSGNTFFRILLNQLYGLSSQSQYNESGFPVINNLTGNHGTNILTEPVSNYRNWQFVKTHDLPVNDQYPAIYLVRDGRDALVSHAHYIINHEKYDLPHNADTFWYLLYDLISTENHFGGWAQNVTTWLERKAPTAYVRFEELIANPQACIQRAFGQLEIELPAEKIAPPTNFAELQTQLPVFFRRGKVGTWHDEMPEELQKVFWQHHGTVMEKLGYAKSGEVKAIELAEVAAEIKKHRLSLATTAATSQPENHSKTLLPEVAASAMHPVKLGELQLFHDYSNINGLTQLPEVSDFYELLNEMRLAVHRGTLAWTSYDELVLYASVCFWMIRKLEYSFATRSFNALVKDAKKLKILDVGCGVVPLCNWMAKRDHSVTAIDPSKSHIEFAQTHLNNFYQSEVTYETVSAEKLPYADATFDLATCISVLEHIPPGNDGLALLEIARVLKPGGHLILTFDVSPDKPLQKGENPFPANPRRFRYPFTHAAVEKLFQPLQSLFEFSPSTLITPFRSLTWDSVHQFWALTQHHDERAEPLREYLAAGIVMQRTNGKISETISPNVAFITGQAAIEQQLDFFEYHASQRLQTINQLVRERDRLQELIATETVAKETQDQINLQKYVEAHQTLIEETSAIRKLLEEQAQLVQQPLTAARLELQTAQQKLTEITAALNKQHTETVTKESQLKNLLTARAEDQARIQKYIAEREALIAETGAIRKAFEEQIVHVKRDLEAKRQGYLTTELKLADEIQELKVLVEKLNQEASLQSKEIISVTHDLIHFRAEAETRQSLAESYQRTIEEQTRVFQLQQEAHSKAMENANLMAEARLRVIEEQQAALEAYRRWSIKGRLKNLVKPQLGVLYQYAPKPIELPAKYNKLRSLPNAPCISIVTPSYGQGEFIERTIKSVLGQNYPNLEYIIQDGASKDETMQVVEKYANSLKHYESVRDSGQTQAINLGFRHANGEIMAYLNSDDLLLPGALNYVASYFAKHPEIDAVYGHRIIIDEYDQEVGRWVMPPHDDEVLSWADYVPQETLFWRRSAWEKAGNSMDESFRFAMDWDLLLRLRDSGARLKRLPRFLGAFRVHPHQKTSAQISDIGNQEMARLRERCAKRPVSETEAWQNIRHYLKRHIAYRTLSRINPFQ